MSPTSGGVVALAPDPALPGRDRLLDAYAVADRLSRTLGIGGTLAVESCGLVRAKYRIGESLRVVYRLSVAGETHLLAARAFGDGTGAAESAWARAVAVATPTGELRPVLYDRDLDAVWWTFPNDRRLRGVADLLRPGRPVAALAGPGGQWTSSEVAELAPERCVTLRARDSGGSTVGYAKAYAPGSPGVDLLAPRYRHLADRLHGSPHVRTPRPLGWSGARRLLVIEPMPGRRWTDLDAGELPWALSRLGAAVAAVHRVPPPAGTPRFARLDTSRLLRSADLVGRARPPLARAAADLADRLAAGRPDEEEPVLLHGDCHPKNALLGDGPVALIDFDQSGTGQAAADVGSLLARLRHGGMLGEHDPSTTAALGASFRDGYAAVRPLPSEGALRWHTAAALFAERVLRTVNRVNRPALALLPQLLDAVDETLRDGGPR